MNKKEFQNKLKNKKFDECIDILRKEIIEIITNKIKEKDSYFSYSTTGDLYKKSRRCLEEEKYSRIAYQLYCFDIIEEKEEYILEELLQNYKELLDN